MLAGRWTGADPGWYDRLPKPAWQPPPWVFGVLWPLNFLALAVSGVALGLALAPPDAARLLVLLAVSVAAALGWAYLFYVPHSLGPAAVSLTAAAALTWVFVRSAVGAHPWAGWLLVPYAAWLTVAASLAWGYHRPGRGAGVTRGRGKRRGADSG